MTVLTALTTLGSEQSKATTNTMKGTKHLLNYLATHPDAKMKYYASDMVVGTKLGGRPRPLRGLDPSLVPYPRTRITVT